MTRDSRPAGVHFRARGRMAVHTIWDYLTRPVARTIDDVPWCAEAISPDWLTAVLCGGVEGARVVSAEVCGGDQGSSVRRQLKAAYNDQGRRAGLPENLFCKTTPTVLTRLATGLSAAGEGRFYRQIRPELNIEAPTCYHSAWDRNSGRSVHLFGDLIATKSASFCRWHSTISRQQAEDIVDTLATVHSLLYDSPRFSSDLKWLLTYEDFFRAGERVGLRECHEQAMIKAEAIIPPDVSRRRAEIWPSTIKALELHRERAAHVTAFRCAPRKLVRHGRRQDGALRLAVSRQGALGAGCFIRHIHYVGYRGSALLGTRPAQALSGPDAGKVRPWHHL